MRATCGYTLVVAVLLLLPACGVRIPQAPGPAPALAVSGHETTTTLREPAAAVHNRARQALEQEGFTLQVDNARSGLLVTGPLALGHDRGAPVNLQRALTVVVGTRGDNVTEVTIYGFWDVREAAVGAAQGGPADAHAREILDRLTRRIHGR